MDDSSTLNIGDEEPPGPPPNRWLLWLFFRPGLFFRHFVIADVPQLSGFAFYLFGVASAADSIDQRMMRDDLLGRGTAILAESWPFYWLTVLSLGVISAGMIFLVGGWWYRKRLEFCGARRPDQRLTRRVYVFASLVWAIPGLLYTVWNSAVYATPRIANQTNDAGGIVLIGFLLWSLFTSYHGVTSAFELRRGAARFWFLVLPIALYAVIFGGVILVAASGLLAAQPDVTHPRHVLRAGFALDHPGNWKIDETIENYDPDRYFSIEPPFDDAVVFVHIGRDFADVGEALDAYRDETERGFGTKDWKPFDRWGRHAGHGLRGEGAVEGYGTYSTSVFAMSHADGRVLVVREICATKIEPKIEPGMRLIRTTFAWR